LARLVMENLKKVYQDGNVALDNFNWELDNGVYGLLGPNGAGKSTLLEIISQNLMPTEGRIMWDGFDIQKNPGKFRQILGYLPQNYGFYPELKIRHILNYLGGLHGLHGKVLKKKIHETLELVNMEDQQKRKIKTLSGGMRQRLAIAQAILHSPKLLVIDEPTTGLDPGERIAFRNLLFDLGKKSIIFLSTHIVKDVEFSCHEMTLLYSGKQRFTGRPVDFIKRVEGRVHTIEIQKSDFEEYSKRHQVIAIQEKADKVEIRFIIPDLSIRISGTKPASVNLEDAYVDFINEKKKEEEPETDAS
jgi:ABC-2 type transport system ATP-binding protein